MTDLERKQTLARKHLVDLVRARRPGGATDETTACAIPDTFSGRSAPS